MIPGLNMTLAGGSALTQRILSQSNNIGYAARGVYRVNVVPEDRKAEYLFRDFVMTLVTAYLTELSFRITETFYTVPKLTKVLQFPELSKLYGEQGMDKALHGSFNNIKNQTWFPTFVQKRLLGSLVKSDSNNLVPELIEREMSDIVDGKRVMKEGMEQHEALIHHLYRRLNFPQYLERLEAMGNITAAEREQVLKIMKSIPKDELLASITTDLENISKEELTAAIKNGQTAIKTAADELEKKPVKKLLKRNEAIQKQAETVEKLREKAASYSDDVLTHYEKASPKVRAYVDDFLHSEAVRGAMKTVQKSASWPKMAVSVALSLVFYGIIANKFDVEKLQPWQEKLFKKRGTTEEVITPAYKALVPGILTTVALMAKKSPISLSNRMGYIGSFAVAGFAGLATYGASWYALFKAASSKDAPIRPKKPNMALYTATTGKALNPLRRAQIFTALEEQQNTLSPNPFNQSAPANIDNDDD